jgi:hypothetical protein
MPLPLYRRAGSLSNVMPARPLVAARSGGEDPMDARSLNHSVIHGILMK